MLSDLGHMVVEAPSARAALDMLQADRDLDLVVTDYLMPGMNGLDLAKEIRKNIPDLPIVLANGVSHMTVCLSKFLCEQSLTLRRLCCLMEEDCYWLLMHQATLVLM